MPLLLFRLTSPLGITSNKGSSLASKPLLLFFDKLTCGGTAILFMGVESIAWHLSFQFGRTTNTEKKNLWVHVAILITVYKYH